MYQTYAELQGWIMVDDTTFTIWIMEVQQCSITHSHDVIS